MRIQNKKHGIYRVNRRKEYKASRLGGLECVRGGEKVIIPTRESKEEKPIRSSRLSRPCFTLSHKLMSRVWPVGRSSRTESIDVSVSIHEKAYTVSQETIYGFQQIRCQGANNHHYCEGNE